MYNNNQYTIYIGGENKDFDTGVIVRNTQNIDTAKFAIFVNMDAVYI